MFILLVHFFLPAKLQASGGQEPGSLGRVYPVPDPYCSFINVTKRKKELPNYIARILLDKISFLTLEFSICTLNVLQVFCFYPWAFLSSLKKCHV